MDIQGNICIYSPEIMFFERCYLNRVGSRVEVRKASLKGRVVSARMVTLLVETSGGGIVTSPKWHRSVLTERRTLAISGIDIGIQTMLNGDIEAT